MKEIADAKKANAAKRRKENALNKSRSRTTKKRGPLAPSSIKSGVKKAVSRARATATKATVSRKKPANAAKKSTNASPKKASTNSKRGATVKLPTIKASRAKAKTTVRVKKSAQTAKPKIAKATAPSSKSRKRTTETKTKTAAGTKSPPALKQPKPKKDVLKDIRATVNTGTATHSPRAKPPARTYGRSARTKTN